MPRTRGEVVVTAEVTNIASRATTSSTAALRMIEETRDALELAIVAGAPSELVDRLALVSGLLDAIADLSGDSPQLRTLASTTLERGRTALAAWRTWQRGMMPRTG